VEPITARPSSHPQEVLVHAISGQYLFAVERAPRPLYPVLGKIHSAVMRKPVQISAGQRWDPSNSVVIWNGQKN